MRTQISWTVESLEWPTRHLEGKPKSRGHSAYTVNPLTWNTHRNSEQKRVVWANKIWWVKCHAELRTISSRYPQWHAKSITKRKVAYTTIKRYNSICVYVYVWHSFHIILEKRNILQYAFRYVNIHPYKRLEGNIQICLFGGDIFFLYILSVFSIVWNNCVFTILFTEIHTSTRFLPF